MSIALINGIVLVHLPTVSAVESCFKSENVSSCSRVMWNIDEDEPETVDGRPYLVEYSFENDNYRASLRVPFAIKDYKTVTTTVWDGEGEVSAPRYVDTGSDFRVDIIPGNGYEVLRVEHNGNDVTDFLNEDNSLDIRGITENAEIVVVFRPVYQITEGDGGEHTKGSGNNLAFLVDKDPDSYTGGIVTIAVDGEYVDLDYDSTVEPETKTITLLSDFLDTLALGEHRIEIYFFDTMTNGVARANFMVVEATTPQEPTDDQDLLVPDTGWFTSESGGIGTIGLAAALAVCGALALVLIRKRAGRNK